MAKKKVPLSNWRRLNVSINYADIIHEYAEECVDILENTSPDRTGKYAKGWTIEEKKDVKQRWYYCTIWNETSYQLTHLLENGHLIVNKRGGVGWANRKPHIAKAYNRIKNPLIKAVEKAKIEVEIE